MIVLTQSYLKECLGYDQHTGVLVWKKRPSKHFKWERHHTGWNKKFSGKAAGSVNRIGYRIISIDNKGYRAHRLVWLWVTGEFPEEEMDHINHRKDDNRLHNLRSATNRENSRNRTLQLNNSSGVTGVWWDESRSNWRASISVEGRQKMIGRYTSLAEAISARRLAETKAGYHKNHGIELCL